MLRSPDLSQAQRFLRFLDPEATTFTIQTFDDTPKRRPGLAGIREINPGNGAMDTLALLNDRDAGIFATVQKTDGKGRQAHNIVEIRCLYADLDSKTLEEAKRKLAFLMAETGLAPPHMIVQTSQTGYHAYWKIRDCALEVAVPLLHSIAQRFGGDHSVCDLARVMRIPGFWHLKGEPYLSNIIYEVDDPAYTVQELVDRLELREWIDTPQPAAPLLAGNGNGKMITQGNRNSHLFAMGRALAKRGATAASVFGLLSVENSTHCDPPLDLRQVDYLAQRAFHAKDSDTWEPEPRAPDKPTPNLPVPYLNPSAWMPADAFVKEWTPPYFLIKGILQHGHVYSLTGHSNAGKTAIAMRFTVHVALGIVLGGHRCDQGRVLYLAGENPDDIRTRLIGLCQHLGIDPAELGMHLVVMVQALPLTEYEDQVAAKMEELGPFVLVVQDTRFAFSGAEDENDNSQAGQDAQVARRLAIRFRVTWLALNHPPHGAVADHLRPRGGSSYLGEIDGNLTAWKEDDGTVSLGHTKLRGAPFDPIKFRLLEHVLEGAQYKQADGDPVLTVIAEPIPEAAAEAAKDDAMTDANRLLRAMSRAPLGSERRWGEVLGMSRSKVTRTLGLLRRDKLAVQTRGRWRLTKAGEREAELIEKNGVLG